MCLCRLLLTHSVQRVNRNAAGYSNAGGIEAHTGAQVTVEFTTFRNNQGVLGGAIHASESSAISLKKSTFIANRASEFVSPRNPKSSR